MIITSESQLKLNDFVEIISKEENLILYNNKTEAAIKINPSSFFIIDVIRNEPKKIEEIFYLLQITSSSQKVKIKSFYFQLFEKGMLEIDKKQFDYIPSYKSKNYKISREFSLINKNLTVNVKDDFLIINSYYKFIVSILLLIITLGFSLSTIYSNKNILFIKNDLNILFILSILIIHIIIHETAHAYFVLKYGARIKSVGIGLLYYFIPHAFVKYSQAFRLNNFQKTTISYVGPLVDSIFIYISITLIYTQSWINEYDIYILLVYQTTILLFNCNLLMPSDLFKMIENFFNLKNLRITSKDIFINNFRKHKKQISLKKNIIYSTYFIICFTYIFLLFILMFVNILFLVSGVIK
ncbi:hypothetical protein [Macrococcus equi]|uniref:hypothetical protein n=1 Tax=Macrococcus equi TaxID=3395462 RepID=UPI0039BE12AA